MSIETRFDKRLRQTVGIHPVFPLGSPMKLGAVLQKRKGTFAVVGNLKKDFGVKNIRTEPIAVSRIDLTTQGVSARTFQGGIEVGLEKIKANAKADLQLEFNRKEAFIFKTDRLTGQSIDNMFDVAQALRTNKRWRFGQFFVVFEIYNAKDFTFQANLAKSSKTKFSGSGSAIVKFLTLGLSAGLSRSGSFNAQLDVFGAKGPVGFAVARIRKDGLPVLDV
jgi:hypothetical protein